MTDAFREYLHRPEQLAEKLKQTEEQLQEIWAVCTKMSTSFDRVGSSGGGGDAKDGPLATYAQLARDLEQRREELNETENEMLNFFDAVLAKNPEYGVRDVLILRKRYIERTDWKNIQCALKRRGFQCGHLQTAYYWHKGALARAEKIWEETNARIEQAGA